MDPAKVVMHEMQRHSMTVVVQFQNADRPGFLPAVASLVLDWKWRSDVVQGKGRSYAGLRMGKLTIVDILRF